VPHDITGSLNLSIIVINCFLTSCALFNALACTKFSKHHAFAHPYAFHASYTVSRVK
jgi:hypothetical protein